jgi:hypothetical protein
MVRASQGSPGATPASAFRPRWWALLSVSLGLMALVAASSHPRHPAPTAAAGRQRRRAATALRHRAGPSTGRPAGAGAPETPPVPTAPLPVGSAATTPAGTAPAGTAPAGTAPAAIAPTTTAPTTTAPTTTAPTTTTPTTTTPTTARSQGGPPGDAVPPTTVPTTAAPSAGGADESSSQPGNLEYPDNVSAAYPLDSGGGVAASATWTGAPVLELSVDCPGGRAGRTGASGLAVSVGGPAGACTVTLAEPAGVEATVAYTLVLQYPGT